MYWKHLIKKYAFHATIIILYCDNFKVLGSLQSFHSFNSFNTHFIRMCSLLTTMSEATKFKAHCLRRKDTIWCIDSNEGNSADTIRQCSMLCELEKKVMKRVKEVTQHYSCELQVTDTLLPRSDLSARLDKPNEGSNLISKSKRVS